MTRTSVRFGDDAQVVRCGKPPFDPTRPREVCVMHVGFFGFSIQRGEAITLDILASPCPNRKVGVATVGAIRSLGYDVVAAPGKANHATVVVNPGWTREDCRDFGEPIPGGAQPLAEARTMKTIFADYNALTESDSLRLNFRSPEGDRREFDHPHLDWAWLSDGEVIVGAQIKDDPRHGLVGVPDWKTIVHLDDDDALDFQRLWAKIQVLLRDPGHTSEREAEVFRLLMLFEQLAPPAIRDVIPPGFLPLRRAGALHFLGEPGLALLEVRRVRCADLFD